MHLLVDDAIWDLFPGLRIVLAWAEGIDNRTARPDLTEALDTGVSTLREGWSHPNPQSHPYIAAWRDAARAAGFSGKKFPSSIEALSRRALSGRGIGSINPLVDFYNAVSLRHLVPAGGWDLDRLGDGDLRLTLARGDESFFAIGSPEAVSVEAAEVSYIIGSEVVTRHFVWRQSERGKLTPDTRRVLLISECLAAIDDATASAVIEDLTGGLEQQFQADPRSVVLVAGGEPPELNGRRDG